MAFSLPSRIFNNKSQQDLRQTSNISPYDVLSPYAAPQAAQTTTALPDTRKRPFAFTLNDIDDNHITALPPPQAKRRKLSSFFTKRSASQPPFQDELAEPKLRSASQPIATLGSPHPAQANLKEEAEKRSKLFKLKNWASKFRIPSFGKKSAPVQPERKPITVGAPTHFQHLASGGPGMTFEGRLEQLQLHDREPESSVEDEDAQSEHGSHDSEWETEYGGSRYFHDIQY